MDSSGMMAALICFCFGYARLPQINSGQFAFKS